MPCSRRLDDNFAGSSGGAADDLVRDGFLGGPDDGGDGTGGGEDDGWLRTGGSSEKEQEQMRGEVRTMSESGELAGKGVDEEDSEDEIPDMEDEDDDKEAIIREAKGGAGTTA